MEETGGRSTNWEVLTRNEENLNKGEMPALRNCVPMFSV